MEFHNREFHSSPLQGRVMRRVYAIWFVRRIRHSHFVRVTALLCLLLASTVFVSYAAVWHNMNQMTLGVTGMGSYLVEALTKAEFVVQTLATLAFALVAFLLWDAGWMIGRAIVKLLPSRRSDLIQS